MTEAVVRAGRAVVLHRAKFSMAALALGALLLASAAQSVAQSRFAPAREARESRREQANDGVVTMMAGRPNGEFLSVADDIAAVVNPHGAIRVLPIVGEGSAQNLRDLSLLRNVDIALTHVAVLNQIAASKTLGPNTDKQFVFITNLFPSELHVLASGDAKSVADLKGKRVNFGNEGSGTAFIMPSLFKTLGLDVQASNLGQAEAVERMSRGELDATACICSAPVAAFAAVKPDAGFKLLPVPLLPAMEKEYLPAKLDAQDYPNLGRAGEKVETVALRTVLVTFNWPINSVRYNRIARFVETFFGRFEELAQPPRHGRWSDVNIAAGLPGWQRFPAAQTWIDKAVQRRTAEVQKNLAAAPPPAGGQGGLAADNDRLFREFLDWMRERERR